jgi:hypothetical protein
MACGPFDLRLALRAVEARHVAAREHRPHHTVGGEVEPARSVALVGRQEQLRERGLTRVRSRNEVDDVAGLIEPGESDVHRLAPDGVVDGARLNPVEGSHNALVLGGVEWLIGLHIGVALAVAVGVDDDRRPALRLHVVAGREVLLGVEPPDHAARRSARARPQGLIGVANIVAVDHHGCALLRARLGGRDRN